MSVPIRAVDTLTVAMHPDTIDVNVTQSGWWTVFDVPSRELGNPNRTRKLFTDHDGSVWLGLDDGVMRYSNGVWEKYTSDDGLMAGAIDAIAHSPDGSLWFAGTHHGKAAVARHDSLRSLIFSDEDGLVGTNIADIVVDTAGTVWARSQTVSLTVGGLDGAESDSSRAEMACSSSMAWFGIITT